MKFPFTPWVIAESVVDLHPDFFRKMGIRLVMLDFDNTVVPYTTDVPTKEVEQWLSQMQASEVKICVVSNSHNLRVKNFCQMREIPCITGAKKPFAKGISECLRKFNISPKECALVGDQIYTDVLGANCTGVHSVLVRSIHNHTIWLKLRHIAELPFIAAAKSKRLK